MDDVIDYGKLLQLVEAGVESTARQLEVACAGQRLTGYALCTDDEVCGVYHVACTAEHAATAGAELRELLKKEYGPESGVYDVRFKPEEWKLDAERDDLEAASKLLALRADLDVEGDCHTQCEKAFECLVLALERCRSKGIFADDVYLCALSMDPCDAMERMGDEAVLRLNAPGVVREWRRVRLAEAREVLARRRASQKPKSWDEIDSEARIVENIAALEAELGSD
jgi:hypothetical protein